ncbi:sterol desaturase family protein [Catalinimonas niigatensis]|uniref:sterol desaturase family protein n=1 Tax=Catalinimonas niigatensis TaxID=1397264 RepID=UPI002AA2A79C|nr:sterol desaturase family protein [Catalinimonas niigatensis]WPP51548.1 sterol desaturase family protein [Catalinimonas niigatensis]
MSSLAFLCLGFGGMEIFSWFFHKYVMHGPLWCIHKTHHHVTKSFFELNDIFSFVFGAVAVVLIFSGIGSYNYRFWLGIGISAYGLSYFILHDILIHRRVKTSKKPVSRYFIGISKAHRSHHKTNKKKGAVSFGLLLVPKKYFRR